MKFTLVTLGCPKNQVDSEKLVGKLLAAGHRLTDADDADLVLLNTCSFIESAKVESVENILKSVATGRRVIVLGCLPERYGEELRAEIPEVEAFFGVGREEALIDHLGRPPRRRSRSKTAERPLLNAGHFAYLKIAEGCDNRCTYCVIPSIRGPYRSTPVKNLLAEARGLSDRGVKELILVAQDTTAYGRDLAPPASLGDLIARLSNLPFPWIRILYAYPDAITDDLLDVIRDSPHVLPYLDIPLQHSEPSVLKRMGRGGRSVDPRRLIERIRNRVPGITLRSTFIVGFPGETKEEFDGLMQFLEETRLDRVGAFAYSREEGTPASRMKGQVSKKEKQARLDAVMGLQAAISFQKNSDLVGRTLEVMIDECEEGVSIGRTRGDAPEIDGSVIIKAELKPGVIVRATITGAQDYDLEAVLEAPAVIKTGRAKKAHVQHKA